MYKLPYYTEHDQALVLEFMKAYPFAVVTACTDSYPVATHLPLHINEIDGKMMFTGHLMRNSDHHQAFSNNNKVLVVFNGPHCPVSANWYTKPGQASTWNYMTVHAKGDITFLEENGTIKSVEDITNKYVGHNTEASFDRLPKEYIYRLAKAIVGFTIDVQSYENVFKLSQNHDAETRESIATHLETLADDNARAIAREMRKRL